MKTFRIINLITFIMLSLGGITLLAMGLFDTNILRSIVAGNDIAARVMYSLIGISALWLIFSAAYTGHIGFPWEKEK